MQITTNDNITDIAIGAVAGGVSYLALSQCSPKVKNYVASLTPLVGTAIVMPVFMEHASPKMVLLSALYGGVSVLQLATRLNNYNTADAHVGSLFVGLCSTLIATGYRH